MPRWALVGWLLSLCQVELLLCTSVCLFLLLPLIMVGTNQLLWKSWVYARMQCLCWFLELLVTNSLVTIPVPLLSLTQLYWRWQSWLYSMTGYCTHLLLIILWTLVSSIWPGSVCLITISTSLEPAILLMFHSLHSHPQITASLLDFLCQVCDWRHDNRESAP